MRRFLPLLLALAGLILFGQGAYIHAKAALAQVLLERAFTETVVTGRDTKPWSWAGSSFQGSIVRPSCSDRA